MSDAAENETMNLTKFDQKYVRLKDIYRETYIGMAVHHSADYCYHEYAVDEEALQIGDCIIYASQIAGIEEVTPHGSAELWTEHLILRRYREDDAADLHQYLGTDPAMSEYSGWNPYATPEMAQEMVRRFIEGYGDDFGCANRTYSWVLDVDDVIVGTIGAYDYTEGAAGDDGAGNGHTAAKSRIEVGLSIVQGWWGRGFATEALTCVLHHLTENEGIDCVTAWCAADNIGSWKAMEKAGMQRVATEKDGLVVGDRTYDKLIYEYRKMS